MPIRPAAAALLLVACASTLAQDARDIADKVLPSVAMLVMKDANGEPIAIGSGFVVHPGVLVTNAHVIREASSGTATFTGDKTEHAIVGVVAFDAHHDLALLKIADDKAKPLPLADAAAVKVGDTVYAAGSPQGMAGTFSNGIISAVREVEGGTILQTTAPISPGSSGGPLVNSSGQVVGVAVALIANGQNLNFAIAASHAAELLRVAGDVQPLGGQARQASVLDRIGGPAVSGIEMHSFTWDRKADEEGRAHASFTIVNRYSEPIAITLMQVLVYDIEGHLIDARWYSGFEAKHDKDPLDQLRAIIGARRRLPLGSDGDYGPAIEIDARSVRRIPMSTAGGLPLLNSPSSLVFPRRSEGKVEFRILDFEIIKPGPRILEENK